MRQMAAVCAAAVSVSLEKEREQAEEKNEARRASMSAPNDGLTTILVAPREKNINRKYIWRPEGRVSVSVSVSCDLEKEREQIKQLLQVVVTHREQMATY